MKAIGGFLLILLGLGGIIYSIIRMTKSTDNYLMSMDIRTLFAALAVLVGGMIMMIQAF